MIGATQEDKAPTEEFSHIFKSLECLRKKKPLQIKLQGQARFFVIGAPKRIPLQLLKKVKKRVRKLEELERMAKLGIISPIEEADWCAPIIVVQKLNGDIRICVFYAVKQER